MKSFEIDVDGPQPADTPEILYKYRYFDKAVKHLKLVKDAELWFTSARSFNDPFDSALQYQFEDEPRGVQMEWALEFLKRVDPDLNHSQRRKLAREQIRQINRSAERLNWFKANYVETNYKKFGVCCLAGSRDDLLMWAHYSANHTGFCVGLSTAKLEVIQRRLVPTRQLLDMARVAYSNQIPAINFYSSMISNRWHVDVMTLLTTKSVHWSYEKEYRLIYWDRVNFALKVGHEVLSEVVLGCRISDSNRDQIMSILDSTGCSAAVYQSRKHDTAFSLELNRIR